VKKVALLLLTAAAVSGAGLKVRIRDQVVEMPVETYVAAVLAGESSVFESTEALKAMAVAARTYAVRLRGRHLAEGFDLCDTTHCQRVAQGDVTTRLQQAAADTAGELLWFAGKPAFTPYTADCGGRTEDADAVWPGMGASYLRGRADAHEVSSWDWTAGAAELAEALRHAGLRAPRLIERVTIVERTASGRARTLLLASRTENIRVSASSFRFAIGRIMGWNTVRGSRFEVRAAEGRILFEGQGAGHGVGLCQRGADAMGRAGAGYHAILAHYYPGAIPGVTARGLSWQRLGSESLTLLTTRPDTDRAALAAAGRAARNLEQRTGWVLPAGIEIRAYPDLDTFRNATAEPGWVAARTDGRIIHLQPVALLESRNLLERTLRHELLHVVLEAQSAPGLPVWFREGLAQYLEGPGARVPAGAGTDTGIRQRTDAARARSSNAAAVARVTSLAKRYGEGTVLGWLKRGLPPEVTNATASQPATSRR
jgi:stage II sporulation protein D